MILPRTGIGLDVHAYSSAEEPRPLWLGGLLWEGERGLAGHSDGDPVAHAAADALFPPRAAATWEPTSAQTGLSLPAPQG